MADRTAVIKRVPVFNIPQTCVLCDVPPVPGKTITAKHTIQRGGFNEVLKVSFPLCKDCVQVQLEKKKNYIIAAVIASCLSLPVLVIYLYGFTNAGIVRGGPNGNLLIASIGLFGIIYWISTVLLKRRLPAEMHGRLRQLEYAASISYFDSVFVKFFFSNANYAEKFRGLNEVYNPPSIVDFLRV
jgi:hypothetical protein